MNLKDYLIGLGLAVGVTVGSGFNSARANEIIDRNPTYTDSSSQLPDTSGSGSVYKAMAEYLTIIGPNSGGLPRDYLLYNLNYEQKNIYLGLMCLGEPKQAINYANLNSQIDNKGRILTENPDLKGKYDIQRMFGKKLEECGYSMQSFNGLKEKVPFISFKMPVPDMKPSEKDSTLEKKVKEK